MAELEQLLNEYLLTIKQFPKESDENSHQENENNVDAPWKILDYLKCEETWKIFVNASFDIVALKIYFNSKTDEERSKIFKFGMSCLLSFAQCNFTGPDFDETTEDYFNNDMFKLANFEKMLSVNNEDINCNTKYPILLVTAKIIFEWCIVHSIVNIWWYWRALLLHQQILDELSPTLLSDADRLYKLLQVHFNLKDSSKVSLDVEVAQLYLLFRNIPKAKEHITSACSILGVEYDYVGILGKRTKYQEKDIAQLSLKVKINDNLENSTNHEIDDSNIPKNLPLNDDLRLNTIEFTGEVNETVALANVAQKLFITIVQEMLIAKPQDELQIEELMPFIELILSQKNTYCVRVVALLLRCKLESKNRHTIERSLTQCEELIKSFKQEKPHVLNRVADVFSCGLPPMWKVQTQYADLLLNIGLIKNALDIYLEIKLWEEVIVCYTILKLRHKAAEIIRQQLEEKPTVKLWCLLGDSTDDVSCYERAWELSKRRSHRAQRHWGQFLYLRKQYKECISHFEKSVSINPLQSQVWFQLGFAALQTENWQISATAYRRYTTLETDCFEAWNNLAQAYIKIGNKRNAHQAILEALKCVYDNWKVWENFLVVSCDIANYSDLIRAYHRMLDLKGKYLNLEVLSVLVYNVSNDANDSEGHPSSRLLQKTRELLGRIVSIYPGEGYVWELYASLAPGTILRAQRLQRAYRGFTQDGWDKNPSTCQQALHVCLKLAEVALSDEVQPRDSILNSIKLNLSSALAAVKKQGWERELVEQVSANLDLIIEKVKSGVDTNRIM